MSRVTGALELGVRYQALLQPINKARISCNTIRFASTAAKQKPVTDPKVSQQ